MPTRNRLSNSLFLFLLFGIFMEISLTLFLSLSLSSYEWLCMALFYKRSSRLEKFCHFNYVAIPVKAR